VPRGDIAYASSAYFYDLVPALWLKLRDKARLIVAIFHTIPPPWRRSGCVLTNTAAWVENRTMLSVARVFADRIVVDNAALVEELARLRFDRSRIVVSSMGAHVDIVRNARQFRYDAVYLGRFSAAKGLPCLIEAWERVTTARPGATLALVGADEVGFSVEQRILNSAAARNVRVFSGLSDKEVRAVLHEARVFVTASTEEGYGLALLEAMAVGLPCVTFDIPVFREVFPHGRYSAANFSSSGLAQALVDVLEDETLYDSLCYDMHNRVVIKDWSEVAADLWRSCTPTNGTMATR
jgi:glycosyltransferase involved in cell wall biosynthesis